MLDHQKLFGQLEKVSKELFLKFAKEQDIAKTVWNNVKEDEELCNKVHAKKYSLLLPKWIGLLGQSKKIDENLVEYSVLAVDGSQIYYDKHQGPACYLLNVGSVLLEYKKVKSTVALHSEPSLFIISDDNKQMSSTELINAQREEFELDKAWQLSFVQQSKNDNKPYVVLFDGSLIFFQLDSKEQDEKQSFLQKYFDCLNKFYEQKILIAGYMSFPRTKELVNILKLALAQFDEHELEHAAILDQLTDMDVASYFLEPGYRSITFQSKAPISYLYPQPLKPYFCYLHVGSEIVRLEFPAWIAQQANLVDQICKVALDQAHKGKGYPVCLFEAHEQAVIKGYDRELFYMMMQKMSHNKNFQYKKSLKSLKKQYVPI